MSGSSILRPSEVIKNLDSAKVDQEIEGLLKYNSFSGYLALFVTEEKLNRWDALFEKQCSAFNRSVAWDLAVNALRDHFFKDTEEVAQSCLVHDKKFKKDGMVLE